MKIENLQNIIVTITLILIFVTVFFMTINQMWEMQILKNKCIADCIAYNKINPISCVC